MGSSKSPNQNEAGLNELQQRYLEAVSEVARSIKAEELKVKNLGKTCSLKLNHNSLNHQIEVLGREVVKKALLEGNLSGCSPRGVAASAVYFVLHDKMLKEGYIKRRSEHQVVMTQKNIAKKAGSTGPSLRRNLRIIANIVGSLRKVLGDTPASKIEKKYPG